MELLDFERNRVFISKDENFIEFTSRVNKLIEFLDFLSSLIFEAGHIITCISGNRTHLLQTEHLDSAAKTLNSIKNCCAFGSFSDANILVRKYRDDLIMFLFILDVLDNRRCVNEGQINDIIGEQISEEKFIELIKLAMKNAVSGDGKTDQDRCVDAWFDNAVRNLPGRLRMQLSFEKYMSYLRHNESVNEVIVSYNLEADWRTIQDRLNDYTHNNGRIYTQHNLIQYQLIDVIKSCCHEVISRLDFITAFFIVLLILIKPNMIQSTDYIDYLECGYTPPDDSQYLVAPGIQEFIDEYVNQINPELKVFLKNNNKYGMLID